MSATTTRPKRSGDGKAPAAVEAAARIILAERLEEIA
jgi:hypothetical protein